MNVLRFLFGREKSEQELYEESLQEAEDILREIDANRPIAASARKRIPQIIRGLRHDGIQANADLIQRLADISADGYINSHWRERVDEGRVREVFEREYQEAFEENVFFYEE